MRHFNILFLLATLTFSLSGQAQCTRKSNHDLRSLLGVYVYDASHLSKFQAFPGLQFQEFELRTFAGSQYKIVFDVAQADPNLLIEVYETKKGEKTLLWSSKGKEILDNGSYAFFVKNQSKRLKVRYEIQGSKHPTCATMALGFVVKNDIVQPKKNTPKVRIK